MLLNYLKIAIRNLNRHRFYSLINILGLSLGLACCLMIFFHIQDEFSYDQFWDKKDRIYRMMHTGMSNGTPTQSVSSPVPLGPTLKADFPEFEEVIRFWRSRPILHVGTENLVGEDFHFTDPEVFHVFSFPFLKGDSHSALSEPNSIVITETIAKRLFGENDPIGKVIRYEGYPAGERDLLVTGVIKNLPENTHFKINYLASMNGMNREADNWGSFKPIWTYVLLNPNQKIENIEARFPAFIQRYLSERSDAKDKTYKLESVSRIHLYSEAERQMKANGSITSVYLFGGIGFLILLIACINFINLTTARSLTRLKEVGMRKVLGAYRGQLVRQFLGESFLMTFFSLLIGMGLVELFLPAYNSLSGKSLEILWWSDLSILGGIVLIVSIISFISGAYPAFYLSGFRPVEAIKKVKSSNRSGKWNAQVRQSLVIIQFCISIGLITGVIVVLSQLNFLRNKDLGFDKEHVVVLPWGENEQPFADLLDQNPNVRSYSISQNLPVNNRNYDGRSINPEGMPQTREDAVDAQSCFTDPFFLETFGVELIAGRNFSEDLRSDSASYIINEAAVKAFGWNSPEESIGKELLWSGSREGKVIGVVKDFHLESMHSQIDPLVLLMEHRYNWWKGFVSIRIKPDHISETLAFLETNWKELNPEGVYDYFFIDESFQQLHQADQKFGKIVGYFAGLAIVIACIGLLGLIAFAAETRSKEIGIRKVLGASVRDVIWLLTRDFFRLILLASLLAVPLSYFFLTSWLEGFAYRISLGWQNYMLATGLTLIVGWIAMSYQSFKAANANPVESLRNE